MSKYQINIAWFGEKIPEVIEFLRTSKFITICIIEGYKPPKEAYDLWIIAAHEKTPQEQVLAINTLYEQREQTPVLPLNTSSTTAQADCIQNVNQLMFKQYNAALVLFEERVKDYYKENKLLILNAYIKELKSTLASPRKSPLEKVRALEVFQERFHGITGEVPSHLVKALFVAITMLAVTLCAWFVGYAIGFAAGAWSGPGAFLTGLIAGEAAAASVAGIGGGLGLMAGIASTIGLFRHQRAIAPLHSIHDESKALINATIPPSV